jgi:hypothetical protein
MNLQQVDINEVDVILNRACDQSKPVFIVYDIETAPLRDDLLWKMYDESKLKLPPPPGKFDPDSVKYGNAKKPELRQSILREAQAKHLKAIAEYPEVVARIKDEGFGKFRDGARLRALTGWITAIGYGIYAGGDDAKAIMATAKDMDGEKGLLEDFWEITGHAATYQVIGFNSDSFDLPFIVQRSMKYGLGWYPFRGRLSAHPFCDLAKRWQCGQSEQFISLHNLSLFFGLDGKAGEVEGKYFYETLLEDEEAALSYLFTDIELTTKLAKKLGMLDPPGT